MREKRKNNKTIIRYYADEEMVDKKLPWSSADSFVT